MELFFFIILAIIFFGIFGDGKKRKVKPQSSTVLSPAGVRETSQQNDNDYPRDWKNYEAAERGEQSGMQDDLDPSALFRMSKDRVERAQKLARKAAASKLSSHASRETASIRKQADNVQSFDTTAKSARNGSLPAAKQPPLVRDMNLSRSLFLSGGRGNIFGERQKKSFGLKSILGVLGLGVVGLYLVRVLGT